MPTYDYRCGACGHEFEEFQSITADPLRKCPECQRKALERVIGPGAGFLFRGNGFYTTDYRSNSYQEGKKSADKPASGGSDTGGGKQGGGKQSGGKKGGGGQASASGGKQAD